MYSSTLSDGRVLSIWQNWIPPKRNNSNPNLVQEITEYKQHSIHRSSDIKLKQTVKEMHTFCGMVYTRIEESFKKMTFCVILNYLIEREIDKR